MPAISACNHMPALRVRLSSRHWHTHALVTSKPGFNSCFGRCQRDCATHLHDCYPKSSRVSCRHWVTCRTNKAGSLMNTLACFKTCSATHQMAMCAMRYIEMFIGLPPFMVFAASARISYWLRYFWCNLSKVLLQSASTSNDWKAAADVQPMWLRTCYKRLYLLRPVIVALTASWSYSQSLAFLGLTAIWSCRQSKNAILQQTWPVEQVSSSVNSTCVAVFQGHITNRVWTCLKSLKVQRLHLLKRKEHATERQL